MDRLNSGKIFANKRMIRLCREGTPDAYMILLSGQMVWIECKTDIGKLSDEQVVFRKKIARFPNHDYIVARSSDDLANYFKRKRGDLEHQ